MTAQVCDTLRYRGRLWLVQGTPLEPYLDRNPDRRPNCSIVSTALRRGYTADWTIQCGRLILCRIEIDCSRRVRGPNGKSVYEYGTRSYAVNSVVKHARGRPVATWYTGSLILADGELTNYVHAGFGSSYERYLVLYLREGKLCAAVPLSEKGYDERHLDHRQRMSWLAELYSGGGRSRPMGAAERRQTYFQWEEILPGIGGSQLPVRKRTLRSSRRDN